MAVRPLPNLEVFHRPRSLDEAVELLQDPAARPLGGGTNLALSRHPGVKALVDLRRLGLEYVRPEDGGVRIGASTRVQRIARAEELVPVAGGIVRRAAASYLSRPHRNRATLGGLLASAYTWADLPAALLAVGGQVRIVSKAGQRVVDLDAFFHPSPAKAIGRGLIESVWVPLGGLGGFARLAKTETDVPIAAAAARIETEEGRVASARIALVGVVAAPARAAAAERVLAGQPLSGDAASEAAETACDGLEPVGDIRGSAAYRAKAIPVLVRRAILECLEGSSP